MKHQAKASQAADDVMKFGLSASTGRPPRTWWVVRWLVGWGRQSTDWSQIDGPITNPTDQRAEVWHATGNNCWLVPWVQMLHLGGQSRASSISAKVCPDHSTLVSWLRDGSIDLSHAVDCPPPPPPLYTHARARTHTNTHTHTYIYVCLCAQSIVVRKYPKSAK